QLAPGLVLGEGRGYLLGRLQLPTAIGTQLWYQPLPVPPQLERLHQVQRLPPGLRKQDVAQPEQRPLLFRPGGCPWPDGAGANRPMLTLLPSTPCSLRPERGR